MTNSRLQDHFPPALYVRAARRLRGPHVFTQNTPKDGGVGNLSIGVGCYNFDSHNAQRMACRSKADCAGRGPAHVADNEPFAWDEGDVEIGPGRYEIPLWVTMPHPNETTNVIVIATPSASHIGMSTLRMEPQFMIIGHSVGVAAAMAAATAAQHGTVANVNAIDIDTLHARLLTDGQTLTAGGNPHPPGPSPTPLSVCELGRCFGVDAAAAMQASKVFNDSTCGANTTTTAGSGQPACQPLLPGEWLANDQFWNTKNVAVGSLIYAISDTVLKKSTVHSSLLPPSMIKAVTKGAGCRLLNTTAFATYTLCAET